MNLWKLFRIVLIVLGPYVVLRYGLFLCFPSRTLLGINTELQEQGGKSFEIKDMEEILYENKPEVIIVGSSIAAKGVRIPILANLLDLPIKSVMTLKSSTATMPTMYAMIQGRIFANGIRPKLIIIVSTPRWIITNRVVRKIPFQNHKTDPDQHLINAVGQDGKQFHSFSAKTEHVRDEYLSTIRYLFGEKIFNIRDEDVVHSLDQLFAFEKRINQDNKSVLPVSISQAKLRNPTLSTDRYPIPPSDVQLYPHLIELVHSYNCNILFVEFPVSQEIQAEHDLPKGLHHEMAKNILSLGGGLLSYFHTQEPMIFADLIHLNLRGSEIFTKKLASDIKKINALGEMKTELPSSFGLTTLEWKTLNNKVPRKFKDSEERSWLYPGEQIELKSSEHLTNTEFHFQISSDKRIEHKPSITLNGSQLKIIEEFSTRTKWYIIAELPSLSNTDQLLVQNPTKGSLIYLHRVSFKNQHIFPKEQRVSLLNAIEISYQKKDSSIYQSDWSPAPIPKEMNAFKNNKDVLSSKMGTLSLFSPEILKTKGILCQPLQLIQDNSSPLENSKNCNRMARKEQAGHYCFRSGMVYLFPESDTATYKLTLKDNINCDGIWLYPNDTVKVTLASSQLSTGFTKLRITGGTLSKGKWNIKINFKNGKYSKHVFGKFNLNKEVWLKHPIFDTSKISSIEISSTNFIYLSSVFLSN